MKIPIPASWFALALAALATLPSHAQTADELVTQGRQLLASEDLSGANAKFAGALALAPNHETANALQAVTRLLVLPGQPAVKSLLDRLGVATAGRQVLRWTAGLPRDGDGVPLAPSNLSAQEIINSLHNEVLPELAAAAANLGKVTTAGFRLDLTAAETKTEAVTLDLGDVRLLKAGVHFVGYLGQTLSSWNFDAQLSALRAYALTGEGTLEQFLKGYPQLLSHSSQADLTAARNEFSRFVENYLAASELIRARPLETTRLFNLDLESDADEAAFRERLLLLQSSLTVSQPWPEQPDIRVNLGRQFAEGGAPRSWLPEFQADAVVSGTLPYPALGGMVEGWSAAKVERELFNWAETSQGWEIAAVSRLNRPVSGAGGGFNAPVQTLAGHSYALLRSGDLINWTEVKRFVAQEGQTGVNLATNAGGQAFFRLVELEDPANDNLAARMVLEGDEVAVHQRLSWASFETGEEVGVGSGSIWFEWTPSQSGWLLVEDVEGAYYHLGIYRGGEFPLVQLSSGFGATHLKVEAGQTYLIRAAVNLWPFPWSPQPTQWVNLRLRLVPLHPANDAFANATLLAGESPTLSGVLLGSSREVGEPTDQLPGEGSVWWRWVAPADGRYRVLLESSNWTGSFGVGVFDGATLIDLNRIVREEMVEHPFQATQGHAYYIAVAGLTNSSSGFSGLIERVTPPPNDDFAARTLLEGTQVRAEEHIRGSLDGIVWWTWTAPTDGILELTVTGELDFWSRQLRVFQGASEQSLTEVPPFGGRWPATQFYPVVAGKSYQFSLQTNQGVSGRFFLGLFLRPLGD